MGPHGQDQTLHEPYVTLLCGCQGLAQGARLEFDELDITRDVEALREWRSLSGGVGVPVIALGNDFITGFSPERLTQLVDCCEHSTPMEAA